MDLHVAVGWLSSCYWCCFGTKLERDGSRKVDRRDERDISRGSLKVIFVK